MKLVLIMNSYNCLPIQELKLNNYSIVPIRYIDIQEIRRWRNEQIDVLRQEKIITPEQQTQYYESIIKKSFSEKQPTLILFSFLLGKICIGYGGLTHINWRLKTAEFSFTCDTKRSNQAELYKKECSTFLKLIKRICFDYLKFVELHTETYDIRDNLIKIFENDGFVLTSRLIKNKLIQGVKVDVLLHSLYNKQNSENNVEQKQKITNLVFSVIDEINKESSKEEQIIKALDSVIYGSHGELDSLGLVNFVVAVEQKIEDVFGKSINLADDKAMSQKNSPFQTVETFVNYIYDVLEKM